jgi:hypothetical protein
MFEFFLNIIKRMLSILFVCLTNPNKIFLIFRQKKKSIFNAKLNELWKRQEYILANLPKTNRQFYNLNKQIPQIEHQVGRYLNCKDIVDEIKKENIEGDILEFGTWQGLSLIIFNLIFGNNDRKFIGVDSFEGLPETSTIWSKGDFNNTSYNLAHQNIANNFSNKNQFKLIKGWFNQESTRASVYAETNNVCLIHFDADLGSSTSHALNIIEPYLKNRSKPIYFLFDDWGCHQDEVPDAFLSWLPNASLTYKLQAHKLSTTRLTRYYKITFN